jgi:hypothetical protein
VHEFVFFIFARILGATSKSVLMKLLLLLLCLNASAAFGQLTWQSTEQTFNSKPQDASVTAKYKFKNTGTQPIKIQNVRTSCGCTTTALSKTEYAPGESGEIDARFTFAGRTGQQEKAIMVVTSDNPDSPTILKLRVNIEELVKVDPEVVLWRVGDQPSPKSIHILVAEDAQVKALTVTSNNPGIKVKLTELKPGKEYEAEVTPDNAAQPAQATLMIKTDYPANNPITKYAYARIL